MERGSFRIEGSDDRPEAKSKLLRMVPNGSQLWVAANRLEAFR